MSDRIDSAHILTQAMADTLKDIAPPVYIRLRDEDRPFWKAILNARYEWTDIDLAHAANLARCQADIEATQKELEREGIIISNERGTQIMNPRLSALDMLSRRSVALSTKLQVHAAATIGETKLSKRKNQAKREAQEAMKGAEEDDLIARPTY